MLTRTSFGIKSIQIEVALAQGEFDGGGNTKIIEGLACAVDVTKPGGENNSARIKIYGLKYDTMYHLTMLGFKPLESRCNVISIKAGDMDGPLALVFQGEIISAFADFNNAPNIYMQFEADTGGYYQQMASPIVTVKGEVKVDQLFERFANEMGYSYENKGVTSSVANVCLPGSPIDKIRKLAHDVGCDLIIDDNHVIILPVEEPRERDPVLLNKDTGLIGYPTFNDKGIICKCLYNPNLKYGGLIKVESIVPGAYSGVWRITKLVHSLTSYIPGPDSGAATTASSSGTNTGTNSSSSSGASTSKWESAIEASPYDA